MKSVEPEVAPQDLTVEHVKEAIDLSSDAVEKVEAYYDQRKHLPASNKDVGLPYPNKITSESVKSVTVYSGLVLVKFKDHLQKGAQFTLKPEFSRTQPVELEWRCQPGNIDKDFFAEVMPSCVETGTDMAYELMQAIRKHDKEAIESALNDGAEINQELNGETPLLLAISLGREEIVDLLLSNGADIEQGTAYVNWRTPLMFSLRNSNDKVVKLLIRRGADVNAYDKQGKTVLQHVRDGDTFMHNFLVHEGAQERPLTR